MNEYRIRPWRGLVSGNIYYDIQKAGLFLWRHLITCHSESEAEQMITKLRAWNK